MTFVKSEDGEQISAVNDEGKTVGYIRKMRFGVHSHWRGWRHYTWCERKGMCILASLPSCEVYEEKPFEPYRYWTDAPLWFSKVSEFKDYYGGMGK